MKEKKHWLDTQQIQFIQKMIWFIECNKWPVKHIGGREVKETLEGIVDNSGYTPLEREWLSLTRKAYITQFC